VLGCNLFSGSSLSTHHKQKEKQMSRKNPIAPQEARNPPASRATISVGASDQVLVRENGGIIAMPIASAAMAVAVPNTAIVVDKRNEPVPPITAVICRRAVLNKQITRVGAAVNVIDPGKQFGEVIAPWLLLRPPLIPKGQVRAVGICKDASDLCGHCVNAPSRENGKGAH
jgi:hypothetical protein